MNIERIAAQFSKYRLDGEPVPDDVKVLLTYQDAFAGRTGIELNWTRNWKPWLDTSYLSAQELAKPDIAANVQAIHEVCKLIAFIAAEEDGNYYGYWRGPEHRPVARSPLVCLNNEGQFCLLAGNNFAHAMLGVMNHDPRSFTNFRLFLSLILRIPMKWKKPNDIKYPRVKDKPDVMHKELYDHYLGQKPIRKKK